MFCYFSPKFDQDKSGYVESEILKKQKQTQIAFNSIKCGKKKHIPPQFFIVVLPGYP